MSVISLTLSVGLATVKKGTKLTIFADKIIGLCTMDYSGTVVIAQGGATIPVVESEEEILKLISTTANNITTIKKKEQE